MKRTHEAVNEKESKHISAAVSLIRLLMENFLKLATLWLLIYAINNSVTRNLTRNRIMEDQEGPHPHGQGVPSSPAVSYDVF
ncbi:hypothetical protein AHAS_Ahas18G0138400 [Arachis hypogaea]